MFWLYSTILNIVKVNNDISIFKYLYSNHYLHFLIFLMFLQLDLKNMKLNLKFIHGFLIFIVIFSVIVSIIQQFIPTFFTNPDYVKAWMETERGSLFVSEELRSPSIYSWSGSLGFGLIFLPFVAIVVNNFLIKNKKRVAYLFLFLGLLVAILSKFRWSMVNAIVLFAMIFHYSKGAKISKYKVFFIFLLVLLGIYYLLGFVGINVDKLLADRILETSKGGLTQGTASTRLLAFEIFFKFFPKEPIFGVGLQKTRELITELAGRSSQIHVGYLALFYHYGLIGGLFYMGFIYYLTKTLYLNTKIHGYYSPLYSWIGFLLSNLTLFYLIPFEAGILLVLLLDKYYLIYYRGGIRISPGKKMSFYPARV